MNYTISKEIYPSEILPTLETFEAKIKDSSDGVYTEYSSDWNDDGDVDELDRDILASYIFTENHHQLTSIT